MSRQIAVLAYPGCQLLDISGPWQVFATANDLAGVPHYQLILLGDSPCPLITNSGMALCIEHSWRALTPTFPLQPKESQHAVDRYPAFAVPGPAGQR